MKSFALELIAHLTKMKNRLFTPIAVADVVAVAMAEAGGEIIMMPMHVMQIMMQGLHEDVEEDLHLLMIQEIVFIVAKVVIMLGTVIKNKQISKVESYNMVTMHLAVMMIVQKSCLLCNRRCTLLLRRMICMMMYGMWTQVHQIT